MIRSYNGRTLATMEGGGSVAALNGKTHLQCWSRTPTAAIMGELGLLSMEGRYQQLRLSFWGRLHMGTNADHHPSHILYHASLYAFTHTTAASEVPVPSDSVSEGWSVRFAYEDRIHATDVKMKLGLSLWPAQIKRDLYQLDLELYWNNPAQ